MNFRWKLSDLKSSGKNGLKVFSCFSCAGGSSMGYKMSGFDVIGCNEIDPKMLDMYKRNLTPKFTFLESITTFKNRKDLPKELYNLDILDGSPPCSSFSLAGNRDKDWGKTKKFREGQADQVLDTLFFDFIDLAEELKPKVIIAENVKGMLIGTAKKYLRKINQEFDRIGYQVQVFLLNGARMGLPQKRERVFFICSRKDLKLPKIKLDFNEPFITVKQMLNGESAIGSPIKKDSPTLKLWQQVMPGFSLAKAHPKGSFFNYTRISEDRIAPTITAKSGCLLHWDKPNRVNNRFVQLASSFPDDYDFGSETLAPYVMGMSVPPIMMHKISEQVRQQLF